MTLKEKISQLLVLATVPLPEAIINRPSEKDSMINKLLWMNDIIRVMSSKKEIFSNEEKHLVGMTRRLIKTLAHNISEKYPDHYAYLNDPYYEGNRKGKDYKDSEEEGIILSSSLSDLKPYKVFKSVEDTDEFLYGRVLRDSFGIPLGVNHSEWWKSLSHDQKKDYLKLHPNSKFKL